MSLPPRRAAPPRSGGRTDTSSGARESERQACSDATGEERPERPEAALRRGDLDLLVAAVRVARRPGPKLIASIPRGRSRPRSSMPASARAPGRRHCRSRCRRRVGDDARGRRVAGVLVRRAVRDEAAGTRPRSRRAIRRVAEVDVRDHAVRDHVRRDPALDLSHARHLGEGEPADLDRARLDRGVGRRPSSALSIAFSVVHGRAEWPLTPWNVIRRSRLPRRPPGSCSRSARAGSPARPRARARVVEEMGGG